MSKDRQNATTGSGAPRRNVVLICADQWRGDCLSIAGHPVVETPYLDALADSGVWLRNAYSATPTCVPARMALMTGLRQESHRRVGYADGVPFDIDVTLPRTFRDAGYQTQAIGKMHYTPERARLGFDDVILHDGYLHHSRGRERDPRWYDDYLTWLRAQAGETAVSDYLENGVNCNSVVARPWDKPERLHPTNWVVTQAEQWLYRREPEVPFFLYLSFHRPHAPYDPPAWAFEQYRDVGDHMPPMGNWLADIESLRNDNRSDAQVAHYDQRTLNRARAGYYGHMSHIDQQVQRFLDILGEFGVADNTYVMFTSDHGDMMGDHDMWRKGYAYEGSARVPMILAGPGIAPHQVAEPIVELRDVMPTLLDCAGLECPPSVEGRSILSALVPDAATVPGGAADEPDAAGRDYLHGEHVLADFSMQWIRTARWKYVWMSADGREQLFDMVADRQESVNLAGRPDADAALTECRSLLVRELTGREEGFVADGALVAGRPVAPVLAGPHA